MTNPVGTSRATQDSMRPSGPAEVVGVHPVKGVEVRVVPGGAGPAREDAISRDRAPLDFAQRLQRQPERSIAEMKVEARAPTAPSPGGDADANRVATARNEGVAGGLREVALSKFGSRQFNEWNDAKDVFQRLVVEFAGKGDESRYSASLQRCLERIPLLKTEQLPFFPEPKIVNVFWSLLRAEFDAQVDRGASLSGARIVELADEAIRKTSVNYARIIDAATDVVCAGSRVNTEDRPKTLQYLVSAARHPSSEDNTSADFFRDLLLSLLVLGPRERTSAIESVVGKERPIDLSPSRLIDSLENIPFGDSSQKIINYEQRLLVAVKFGTVSIPFYQSSGLAPKEGVTGGCWYPFFGIGPETGWINKSDDMSRYYDSEKLAAIAELLDSDFGDLRGAASDMIPAAAELPLATLTFFNRDMPAVDMISALYQAEGREIAETTDPEALNGRILCLVALLQADESDRLQAATALAAADLGVEEISQDSPDLRELLLAKVTRYLGAKDPVAISREQSGFSQEREF